MPEPSVAVVIPARNAERFLARAVDSVFATGYANLQVVIVDDGSTDSTVRVAERLCVEHEGRCRFLRHPDGGNHGVSASRNLGIEASDSDWVAFLDADDVYHMNRFDDLHQISQICRARGIEREESISAFYQVSEVRVEKEELDIRWGSNPGSTFGIAGAEGRRELLSQLMQSNTWAISAITIRRSAFAVVGLFDPSLNVAEDCHLWIRLVARTLVVAGDCRWPVSIYFRHGGNAFAFNAENRLAFLYATMNAYEALRDDGVPNDILAHLKVQMRQNSHRLLVATESRSRCAISWRIVEMAVRKRCTFVLTAPLLLRSMLNPPWLMRK